MTTSPRAHETPVVSTLARRAPSGQWTLTVLKCPWCRKRHSHGGGTGPDPDTGPRLSHCLADAQSYWLAVESEAS
jgi:hypothetical protein